MAMTQGGLGDGDITLAGFCFSLDEWEALEPEDRQLLIEVAMAGSDDETLCAPVTRVPAMVDLLAGAARG